MTNGFDATKLKIAFIETLTDKGVTSEDAAIIAEHQIGSMGAIRASTGNCPKGATGPMACMFCHEGHMAECHYPLTCAEAGCSHYQASFQEEIELASEEASLFTK